MEEIMATRFPSEIDLNESKRQELINTLNAGLATSLDLYSQVKQAHWNVRGMFFYGRHELFDEVAANLELQADDMAERAGALGGYAEGTVRLAGEGSVIDEYQLDATNAQQHLGALTKQYKTFASWTRESITKVQRIGDPATEDLLTESLRKLELDLWFLHSHLQD
jgi:starvation-inducible DNA-binding protein